MHRRRSVTVLAFAALCALVAAGCGSTVSSRVASGTGGDGLGAGDTGGGGTEVAAGGDVAGGAAGGVGGSAGTGGAGQTGTARTGSSAGGATGGSAGGGGGTSGAGGSTGKLPPIEIGFRYENDPGLDAEALGVKALTTGDQKKQFEAVVEDVNKRGGLGGRRIKPVFELAGKGASDQRDGPTRAVANCRTFTEDHKVALVVSSVSYDEVLIDCLAKKGVPLVSRTYGGSSRILRAYPKHLYVTADVAMEPALLVMADRLHAANFYGSSRDGTPTQVGIVYIDDPDARAAVAMLKARLQAQKVPVKMDYAVGGSTPADQQASVKNAVVEFKRNGVTHVLNVMGGSVLFFMTEAQSALYFPRYGLTSIDAPTFIAEQQAMHEQLKQSMGAGWAPLYDVDYGFQPPRSAENERCRALLKAKAGAFVEGGSVGETYALGACDAVWFMEAALANSGGTINADSFFTGVTALGTSYKSALTFGTRFANNRHYGPTAARDVYYDETCHGDVGCFKYRSTQNFAFPEDA